VCVVLAIGVCQFDSGGWVNCVNHSKRVVVIIMVFLETVALVALVV
jgi:hypothetical protein